MTDACRDQPPQCGDADGLLNASWTWEPEARYVREARKEAEATLVSWGVGGQDLEDVILVLSELVSNALVHGKGAITVTLTLDRHRNTLTGGVTDGGPDWPREPMSENGTGGEAREDPFAENGRGLFLVGLLSNGWGVARESDGTQKTVWFRRELA